MSSARALLGKTTAPCKLSVIHIALRPRSVQRTATEGTVNAYWLTGTETCIKIISSYVNDEVVADNDVQSSAGLLHKRYYPLSAGVYSCIDLLPNLCKSCYPIRRWDVFFCGSGMKTRCVMYPIVYFLWREYLKR